MKAVPLARFPRLLVATSERRRSFALHRERYRPQQTTLYRLARQHAAGFLAHTEASTGAELPLFIKDEFDADLECGILALGFLRLRCVECEHDPLVAFSGMRLKPLGQGVDDFRLMDTVAEAGSYIEPLWPDLMLLRSASLPMGHLMQMGPPRQHRLRPAPPRP